MLERIASPATGVVTHFYQQEPFPARRHFAGWSQPLESYVAALENVGLAITSLREPVPDTARKGGGMDRWNKVPLFLWLKAKSLPI